MTNIIEMTDKYIMNTYNRLPIVIERGEGVYLFDEKGKKYLDFTAGIAVNCLGYGNKKFIEALTQQAQKFNHCSNLYYSEPQAHAAQKLVENSCFDKVFFADLCFVLGLIRHNFGRRFSSYPHLKPQIVRHIAVYAQSRIQLSRG